MVNKYFFFKSIKSNRCHLQTHPGGPRALAPRPYRNTFWPICCTKKATRSSAQGNCSAKSLPAGDVVDSFLSSLSSKEGGPGAGGDLGSGVGVWGWGVGEVGGGWGRGQGTFQPLCHVLHYHMVLRPEGNSHNHVNTIKVYHRRLGTPRLIGPRGRLIWIMNPGLNIPQSQGSTNRKPVWLSILQARTNRSPGRDHVTR